MSLLKDHIAVVTGAASGIGRAIAAGYAREGARVVLLDVNEQAAAEAAKEIRDALLILTEPLTTDPLPSPAGMRPWMSENFSTASETVSATQSMGTMSRVAP